MSSDELPIVCTRDGFAEDERARQRELWAVLADHVIDKRELAEGYALKLPRHQLETASELMELESRCCGFLSTRLDAPEGQSEVWLTLEGPPGSKRVLETELDLMLNQGR